MTEITTTTNTPMLLPLAGITTMTPDVAADLTALIRTTLDEIDVALAIAYEHRVWEHLEHASWEDYCAAEFDGLASIRLAKPDRQQLHAKLRAAGMPLRAIVAATGSAINTVRNDLEAAQVYQTDTPDESVADDDQVVTPEVVVHRVIGADGRSYAATVPHKARPRRPLPDAIFRVANELSNNTYKLRDLTNDDRFRKQKAEVRDKARNQLVHSLKLMLSLLAEIDSDAADEIKASMSSNLDLEAVTR